MKTSQLRLIYFSATGTTQKVLESIAQGLAAESIVHNNMTLPGSTKQATQPSTDELVILGAPVYGGRLPIDAVKRFQQLKADNTPAILVVVYGNREFEDALLELKNLAMGLGFHPLAGGAFIGEHSFATEDIPIANGRPDDLDVQKAIDFGRRIREKMTASQEADTNVELHVPGSFPYEANGARAMTVSPVTRDDTCSVCGTCASVCPTEAISITESVSTQTEQCIRCCACIKNCPTGARIIDNDEWMLIVNWLHEKCSIRKEPQFFGID